MSVRILVADDDALIRAALREVVEHLGYAVVESESCAQIERAVLRERIDAAILDIQLPDGSSLDLLPRIRAAEPQLPIVLLTGHASIPLAVEAIKLGANHFLTKPLSLAVLLEVLQRLIDESRGRRLQMAASRRDARRAADPFEGCGRRMQTLRREATQLAGSDSPVLILGETGSGKGVLARWLHQHSRRCREALVEINSAGLARELLESELFGHVRGAFTGATTQKVGLLDVAHNGTLFMDEVGDIDLLVQPRLLVAIEEGRFRRVGDVRDRVVDVRLIAATSRNIPAMVAEGTFRTDLYYRISTLVLTVPPLRERVEDIPVLATNILERMDVARAGIRLTPDAVDALAAYPWPGNVRELQNILERAVLLAPEPEIRAMDLRFDVAPAVSEAPADAAAAAGFPTLAQLEQAHIARALRLAGGRVAEAARLLGMSRSTLYDRLRTLPSISRT